MIRHRPPNNLIIICLTSALEGVSDAQVDESSKKLRLGAPRDSVTVVTLSHLSTRGSGARTSSGRADAVEML